MPLSTEENSNQKCPRCSEEFSKRRSDQIYCSVRCRQNASQSEIRKLNPINSRSSPSKRRDNEVLFDTDRRIAEEIYLRPPLKRFDYTYKVVEVARAGHSKLRSLLTNKVLCHPDRSVKRRFHRGCPASYLTAAEIVEAFCRMAWGSGSKEVLYGQTFGPPCCTDDAKLAFANTI